MKMGGGMGSVTYSIFTYVFSGDEGANNCRWVCGEVCFRLVEFVRGLG